MGKALSEMTLKELWDLFPIYLVQHQEQWKMWYIEEERRLRRFLLLKENLKIHHIGSTAINKIWAKPIIDILVEIPLNCSMTDIKELLVENGYNCMYEEENRKFFNRGYTNQGFAEKVFHLHLRYLGDNDELYFRDYMNEHSALAKQYEEMKLSLWKRFEHDRDGYTNAKGQFISEYTKKAKKEFYMQYGPNPNAIYPNESVKSVCYIKNVITRPNIIIGDYTYYDDINGAEKFEEHVTHHYEFIGDKLIIGKFCAIAKGIEFVMNGANHRMNSVTTYPFNIMGSGWEKSIPALADLPLKGDTVIGNDVWIGQNVTVMPGVHIGDGAIIATNSVVAKDVPAYHTAGGNPCKILKKRFDDDLIEHLLTIKWWDWPAEKIFDHLEILCSGDLKKITEIDHHRE